MTDEQVKIVDISGSSYRHPTGYVVQLFKFSKAVIQQEHVDSGTGPNSLVSELMIEQDGRIQPSTSFINRYDEHDEHTECR